MGLTYEIGQQMDIGARRDSNEDFLGVIRPDSEALLAQRGVLLIVADGVGGEGFGDVASRTAVEVVRRVYYDDTFSDTRGALTRAIGTANDVIRYLIRTSPSDASKARATIAAASVRGEELVAASVGDCRVYLFEGGRSADSPNAEGEPSGPRLVQLTQDSTENADQSAAGLGEHEQAPIAISAPAHIADGDVVLVCSDGVWRMVPAQQIAEILGGLNAQAAADELTRAANHAGGQDNIALVVCRARTV